MKDPFDPEGKNGPLLYVIVATGNIHEDAVQGRAAAYAGADAIVSGLSAVGFAQGKWSPSNGRSVFQTAKTRWSSLRMQWPRATSPRFPRDFRRP